MKFFNRILLIRENILHFTDSGPAMRTIESVTSPDMYLESLHPVDPHELTTASSLSKLSTCIPDIILIRLRNDILLLVNTLLLNLINLSPVTVLCTAVF